MQTQIDNKGRTGALTGIVRPGETYRVDHPSPTQIVLTLMVPAARQRRGELVKEKGTGLVYFSPGIGADECEAAALSAPPERE